MHQDFKFKYLLDTTFRVAFPKSNTESSPDKLEGYEENSPISWRESTNSPENHQTTKKIKFEFVEPTESQKKIPKIIENPCDCKITGTAKSQKGKISKGKTREINTHQVKVAGKSKQDPQSSKKKDYRPVLAPRKTNYIPSNNQFKMMPITEESPFFISEDLGSDPSPQEDLSNPDFFSNISSCIFTSEDMLNRDLEVISYSLQRPNSECSAEEISGNRLESEEIFVNRLGIEDNQDFCSKFTPECIEYPNYQDIEPIKEEIEKLIAISDIFLDYEREVGKSGGEKSIGDAEVSILCDAQLFEKGIEPLNTEEVFREESLELKQKIDFINSLLEDKTIYKGLKVLGHFANFIRKESSK